MPILPPTAQQQPSYPSDREALWRAVRALEQRLERAAPDPQAKTGVVTTSRPTVRVLGASVDRDVWRINSGATLEVGDEVVCVETAQGLVVLSVVQVPPLGPYVPPAPSGPYFFDDFNRADSDDPGNGWAREFNYAGDGNGGILDGELYVRGYFEQYHRDDVPLDYFRASVALATFNDSATCELGLFASTDYGFWGPNHAAGKLWADGSWTLKVYMGNVRVTNASGSTTAPSVGDRVSMERGPSGFVLAVNGTPVATASDVGFTPDTRRRVGINIYEDTGLAVTSVDDFQIDDLTP